jgi:hypothetical protein
MFDGGFFAGLDHKSLQAYRNLRGDKPLLLPLKERFPLSEQFRLCPD